MGRRNVQIISWGICDGSFSFQSRAGLGTVCHSRMDRGVAALSRTALESHFLKLLSGHNNVCLHIHLPLLWLQPLPHSLLINQNEEWKYSGRLAWPVKDFHISMCPDLERGDPDWKRAPLETSSSCVTVFCCPLSQGQLLQTAYLRST